MKKVGFGPGFMADENKVALVNRIFDLVKPFFSSSGYELVLLDYSDGLPTRAPLKVLSRKLGEIIDEEGLYAIASHSMCNAMVRSLASQLNDFAGPIVLLEGPNTASKFQIARWALHGGRRPFKFPCERDMVKSSPFMSSLTETSLWVDKAAGDRRPGIGSLVHKKRLPGASVYSLCAISRHQPFEDDL